MSSDFLGTSMIKGCESGGGWGLSSSG
jgi:hypothetical protein